MFLDQVGFLSGRDKKIDLMEIQEAVALKINDWLKFIFNLFLITISLDIFHVPIGCWDIFKKNHFWRPLDCRRSE